MKKQKLLIGLFMASLIVPNILYFGFGKYLNTKNYENRRLAEFPSVKASNLNDFPEDFDLFYLDHAPMKNLLVQLNFVIDTTIFKNYHQGNVVLGDDKWLFYMLETGEENSISDFKKSNLYTEEQKEELKNKLESAEAFVKSYGAENFCYYVAPSKESIYSQYVPKQMKHGAGDSRMKDFEKYMKEHSETYLNFLDDELMEAAKKEQIYFKTDTHVNNLGAFCIVQNMAEKLLGSSLTLDDVKYSHTQNYVGDLAVMLGRENYCKDDYDWDILDYYSDIKCDIIDEKIDANQDYVFQEFKSNSENDRTLMVIGDSFRLKTSTYLNVLYQHTVIVHIDDFTPDMLEKYQPNDVVILTVERNKKYLEDLDQYLHVK